MQVSDATAVCAADVFMLVPEKVVKFVFEWHPSHGVLPDGTCAFWAPAATGITLG
jgi:hypothetical protein